MMNTIESPVNPKEKFASYRTLRLISTIAAYALLVILAVIWLYPILWIVITSFTVQMDGSPIPVPSTYFPADNQTLGLQNFQNLFIDGYSNRFFFTKWFGNTLTIAVFSCLISTSFTSLWNKSNK